MMYYLLKKITTMGIEHKILLKLQLWKNSMNVNLSMNT